MNNSSSSKVIISENLVGVSKIDSIQIPRVEVRAANPDKMDMSPPQQLKTN